MTILETGRSSVDHRRDVSASGLANLVHKAIELDVPCISDIPLDSKGDPRDAPANHMSDAVTHAFEEHQLIARAKLLGV